VLETLAHPCIRYEVKNPRGYANFSYSVWGYVSHKRLGTADLDHNNAVVQAALVICEGYVPIEYYEYQKCKFKVQ